MTFYVTRQYRSVSGHRSEWWWFFSIPYVYSVWWKPDGTKTIEQFLEEQARLVEEYENRNNRSSS